MESDVSVKRKKNEQKNARRKPKGVKEGKMEDCSVEKQVGVKAFYRRWRSGEE